MVLRPEAALVVRYRITREQATQVQLLIHSIGPLYHGSPPLPGRHEVFGCFFYSPWELEAPSETYLTSFDMSQRMEIRWTAQHQSLPPAPDWSHPEMTGLVTVLNVRDATTEAGTDLPLLLGQMSQPRIIVQVRRHEAQCTPEPVTAGFTHDVPTPLLWYQAWGQHPLGSLVIELRCLPASPMDDATWQAYTSSVHVR